MSQYHFIKQLAVVRSINCMSFVQKINGQYTSGITKKRRKNFLSRKTSFGFQRCCSSMFSPLYVCLLTFQDVTLHPRLITGDNVPREKLPPLFDIVPNLSHTARRFALWSSVKRRGTYSADTFRWPKSSDWLDTPGWYSDVCSNFPNCKATVMRRSLLEVLSRFEISFALCDNCSCRTKVHWLHK